MRRAGTCGPRSYWAGPAPGRSRISRQTSVAHRLADHTVSGGAAGKPSNATADLLMTRKNYSFALVRYKPFWSPIGQASASLAVSRISRHRSRCSAGPLIDRWHRGEPYWPWDARRAVAWGWNRPAANLGLRDCQGSQQRNRPHVLTPPTTLRFTVLNSADQCIAPTRGLNRPGSDGGSQSMEDESHGSTEEVPGRAPGASDQDGR
jgi:hypothetical protein